ncbi:MAG: hypothetical protein HQ591_10230 [candidate division Zixibacteria bacterium]|nr:hypothetical protein [Candidatus Tariuqbacter arcticus]
MPKLKLKIDSDIYEKLRELSERAGYSSLEEFVMHLIEKEVSLLDEAENDDELKQRLQGLGYIS